MSAAKDTLNTARNFLEQAEMIIREAPRADDLDAATDWLHRFNVAAARMAQLLGEVETVYARLVQHEISGISEDDWKRIKGSSTLTELWVKGKYPEAYSVFARLQATNRAFQEIAQNTRTALASWRQEREFELRTTIRQ